MVKHSFYVRKCSGHQLLFHQYICIQLHLLLWAWGTFTLYVKNEQQHSTVAQKLLIKWWWNWPSIKSASATYNVLSFKNMFISSSVPRRVLSLKRFQRIWKSHSPLLHHNIASTLKWQVFQLRLIFLNYYYHLFLKFILFWQWCT